MGIDVSMALQMVKRRKNIMLDSHQQDDYLLERIHAAVQSLENAGIHLVDSAADNLLVTDMAVWQINNRDQAGGMPEWLRMARRERWLNDRKINAGAMNKPGEECE